MFGLPADLYKNFDRYVRRVTRSEANQALRKRLSTRNLSIVLLATADDLRDELRKLPRLACVQVCAYDDVL